MAKIDDIVGRGWAFPIAGDSRKPFALTTFDDEIPQAIRIILSTMQGERVMRPTFGSRLHELVFEPNHPQTWALAELYVREALTRWEPRIELLRVQAFADWAAEQRSSGGNLLLVLIDYRIKITHDERSLVYPFYLNPAELVRQLTAGANYALPNA